MNYELAKKLKDAGFPQTGDGGGFVHIVGSNEEATYDYHKHYDAL
jgi:hypothetical protein